ncbi:MAG: ATP-dependent RNA helicase [Fibrobacteres bacterium]|jgi:ATP-dependent helicase HrpB|nr:ATP-dependent RNA helicase [Fibrobacterota bacterium]
MSTLPVDTIESDFRQIRSRQGAVVVASPTGSGKSTRIPLWALDQGKVLVVEPRRIAARSLGLHVAAQTNTAPGELVGWAVRDDVVRRESTRVLFCTPGVALGMLGSGEADDYSTWILDEFHERRADVDAFLAFARSRGQEKRIVVLSATIAAMPVAQALNGVVLEATGRTFPVTIEHLAPSGGSLPDPSALPLRTESALRRLDASEGTVLVFLPGMSEIDECQAWLAGRVAGRIEKLHGTLALSEQQRVLAPYDGLRIVLTTNVAESALTVPDVVAVVDSGLERRIERASGFARLELGAISQASADQRAGRAGRVRPGRCLRLWAQSARLEAHPRPSIQVDDPRDWLLPLLVAGADPRTLPWLDRPRADGVREALEAFDRLGLWEEDLWAGSGKPTDLAKRATRLPLPADLAGFCLQHLDKPSLRDALALASCLSSSRPVLRSKPSEQAMDARHDLARGGGDETLLCRILDVPADHALVCGVHPPAWREACRMAARLREAFGISADGWPRDVQVDALARSLWCLEPRALRRRRGPPGKEEYALGEGAALWPSRDSLTGLPELALALSVHGGRTARGDARVWMDASLGLSSSDCARLGLGRLEVLRSNWGPDGLIAKWNRRVGKEVVASGEGPVTDFEVARASVWIALDANQRGIVQQAWEHQVQAWCVQQGGWAPPPQMPEAWFAQQVLRGDVQDWRLADKAQVLSELSQSQGVYPARHTEGARRWELVWDVRKGKVRPRLQEGKPGKPTTLTLPAGWSLS